MNRTIGKWRINKPLILIGLLAIGVCAPAAWSQQVEASNAQQNSAHPGTVNYIEGQVQLTEIPLIRSRLARLAFNQGRFCKQLRQSGNAADARRLLAAWKQ